MKDIKNITVNYDNNESKTITKGLVIDFCELDTDLRLKIIYIRSGFQTS